MSTTLAKKIETGTHVKLQARACSIDHAPVPAGAWLSQFFWPGWFYYKLIINFAPGRAQEYTYTVHEFFIDKKTDPHHGFVNEGMKGNGWDPWNEPGFVFPLSICLT